MLQFSRDFNKQGVGKELFMEFKDWLSVDIELWKRIFGRRRLQTRAPAYPEKIAFRYAARMPGWPLTSTGYWRLRHLYDGRFVFEGREWSSNALAERYHFTQSAGMILLHPVIAKLWERCGSIVKSLRARAFVEFGHDPDEYFSTGKHDRFGFVEESASDRRKFGSSSTSEVAVLPDPPSPSHRFAEEMRELEFEEEEDQLPPEMEWDEEPEPEGLQEH